MQTWKMIDFRETNSVVVSVLFLGSVAEWAGRQNKDLLSPL